jgi:hypothetical protein
VSKAINITAPKNDMSHLMACPDQCGPALDRPGE